MSLFESYYHRDDKDTPLDVVTALLVLSTKYDFKDLRKDVVFQISQYYPMTFEDFDGVNNYGDSIFGHQRYECALPLLKAAFKTGIDALLPILFLSGACQGISSILRMPGSMDPDCLNILLEGRELLNIRINAILIDLPAEAQEILGGPQCRDFERCRVARFDDLSHIAQSFFYQIQGGAVVDSHLRRVCRDCRFSVLESIEDKREALWEDIPSFFGYTRWDNARMKLREFLGS